ncbi:MAG: lamin tail domain-containing protein [Bacteroidales bacterium]
MKIFDKLWTIIGLFFWSVICQGQLRINEFQASNINTILDYGGNYLEWVEIYNSGNQTIYLAGHYLTNDLANPQMSRIKFGYINPGKYGIVWLQTEGTMISEEIKLYMDGGKIILFSPDGQLVDSVTYQKQFVDVSYGRKVDDISEWAYYSEPTPSAVNNTYPTKDTLLPAEVWFSIEAGIYDDAQILELDAGDSEGLIRYTTDGSWPVQSSLIYESPILLLETTVVRARLFEEGKLPGKVNTQTYILGAGSNLPTVSISTNPKNFFGSHDGIYVTGSNGIAGYCLENPQNWNQDWERPVNFEYFSPDGVQEVNQLVGTKIYGGCSRMFMYKSLAIYARNKYSHNSLDYKFFQSKDVDKFKAIVLRNSGNDAYATMFRDGFMQTLLKGRMDIDLQAYEPAVIFINGEYWGIQNIREKINEYYPASNYGIDSDEIDMLERMNYEWGESVSGSVEHYTALMDFVTHKDLNLEENYQYVSTQMDINEFLNYYLANIYFQNEDWPHNNVKYWRPQSDGGKWRWVLYDTDFGWGLYQRTGNCLEWATRDDKSTRLFTELLENKDFKNEFIQRMAGHINTTFNPETVTPIYDSIRAYINDELSRHMERWGRPESDYFWTQTEEKMPDFTRNHPDVVRGHFMAKFNISGMYNLSCNVNDPSLGFVKASEVSLPNNFTGSFFNNVPLRLVAVPRSGYVFSHWEGASTSSNQTIFLNLSNDDAITAVFKADTPKNKIYLNEICASNSTNVRDDFGQLEDWVEIYNDNDFDVDLAGWYLSDSAGYETQYQIPYGTPELTTVKAKGFLLLWCDNDDRQGPLHTNFKLKKEGELLTLVQQIDQDYHYVDSLLIPSLESDMTYGIMSNSNQYEYMMPTPMAVNEPLERKELLINEFLAKNSCGITDEDQEMDDWIEIYNPTSVTIDLGGLFFTDSLQNQLKYMIPTGDPSTKISPFGFKILWADNQPEQGPLHLGFRLDSKTEQIGVYQVGAGYLDTLSYNNLFGGDVMGRYPDGKNLILGLNATPGSSNLVHFTDNLFINEFMASNRSTVHDEFGEYDDWIEIYNNNDFPVDIGGLYITDSLANPAVYRIPTCHSDSTTIPAKGYMVLWADNQEEQGVLHLDFKLSNDGEQIGLIQSDGKQIIDSLSYGELPSGLVMGRFVDGGCDLRIVTASPGACNILRPSENLYLSEIVASGNEINHDQFGEFDDWIEVYNHNDFAVDLGGFFITDSIGDRLKYRIPAGYPDSTTIAPKGYLILWADDQQEQGVHHLGFKLSGDGEQLALVDPEGTTYIDTVTFPNQFKNFSYSRLSNTGDWINLPPTYSAFNDMPVISGIHLNEFMASNTSIEDDHGNFNDWIELYNSNDFPVNLGGLYITDSLGNPAKYRIPSHSPQLTTIPANGYYILYGENEEAQEINHVSFKLSRKGEQLALIHYDMETILDSVTYSEQYSNSSYSRIMESERWTSIPPTPGGPNNYPDLSKLVINEVMGNNLNIYCDEANEYDDWIELYNSGNEPLDIGGLFLSDSLSDPYVYRISSEYPDSTTIPGRGFIVLWADNSEDQGIMHIGFKVSKSGEQIGLFGYLGEVIDTVSFPCISPNLSWGRVSDADIVWTILPAPTPLRSNLSTDFEDDLPLFNALTIYPNPVTDKAFFNISLEEPGDVRIEVIDGNGKYVTMLEQYHNGSGPLILEWDCKNASGQRLNNGLYYCRILTRNFIAIRKLIVL